MKKYRHLGPQSTKGLSYIQTKGHLGGILYSEAQNPTQREKHQTTLTEISKKLSKFSPGKEQRVLYTHGLKGNETTTPLRRNETVNLFRNREINQEQKKHITTRGVLHTHTHTHSLKEA